MKQWEIKAEANMNASHIETVIINANTERKARIIADKKLKKNYFAVNIISIKMNPINENIKGEK